MKLSILDQCPIFDRQTAKDALYEACKLAQQAEQLGYARYWVAEHHDLRGLACPAPEVLLAFIGAHTSKIRIGAGAILLPHYKPYKVAELFNMLATLFPNRIDLGIGRAPGGSAEATNALSDRFLQQVWDMPKLITELLLFLDNEAFAEHDYSSLSASPVPDISPVPWLLGTSKKSAILAAEKGLAYNFGLFMSDKDVQECIELYKNRFRPRKEGEKQQLLLTVSVICAHTKAEAEAIATRSLQFASQNVNTSQKELEAKKEKMVIGDPVFVKEKLQKLVEQYQADEVMIVTNTDNPLDRLQSFQLLANECFVK
ncbi:LLM class flavin-dependent oxidoreductase [Alkalihalobacterium bogoriense]|uniref:LLM class flavin-dependent oxidoreductase n=1 Tax=Alkalihalobacterium bogoriense TaxID=246272 RepID=UPI0004788593|nr:LLM class flavin-dependent oxidoreductase [Alkalihalobacterium bogoriense]